MDEARVEVIAELANEHDGSASRAAKLVDAAAETADAVKFQVILADELAVAGHSNYDLYRRLELAPSSWSDLVDRARAAGLEVYADVYGEESAALMADRDVDRFKIHTADVSNGPLLGRVATAADRCLLSVGGSTPVEIREALDRLESGGLDEAVLIYGFQNYPTTLSNSNLRRLHGLGQEFDRPLGYASHVDGSVDEAVELPAWAVAAGAEVLEVHLTLDRSREGPDFYSSLEPDRFADMVANVRAVEPGLGTRDMTLTQGEREYRAGHKKTVVTTAPVSPGDRLTEDRVALKRVDDPPVGALTVLEGVLGTTVTSEMTADEPLRPVDLDLTVAAVLACRAESTRLYGKPLQRLGDRPIIEHLTDRLGEAERIDEIVLAIADTPSKNAFVDFADEHCFEYVVGDEEDVLGRLIRGGEAVNADVLVRQTTENPYVHWPIFDEVVRVHLEHNADLTAPRLLPLGTHIEVVGMDALRRSHEYGEDRHRSELATSYITDHPESFDVRSVEVPEELRRPEIRLTVDNPCDLELVRAVEEAIGGDGLTGLPEVLAYLDANPDVRDLNAEKPDGTDRDVRELSWHMYGDGSR